MRAFISLAASALAIGLVVPPAQAWECRNGSLGRTILCTTAAREEAFAGLIVRPIGDAAVTFGLSSSLAQCGFSGAQADQTLADLKPQESQSFSFPDAASRLLPGRCLDIAVRNCRAADIGPEDCSQALTVQPARPQ